MDTLSDITSHPKIKRTKYKSITNNVAFLSILANVNVTFTFAICCRPSVCRLSVVCLCNARAPYSVG